MHELTHRFRRTRALAFYFAGLMMLLVPPVMAAFAAMAGRLTWSGLGICLAVFGGGAAMFGLGWVLTRATNEPRIGHGVRRHQIAPGVFDYIDPVLARWARRHQLHVQSSERGTEVRVVHVPIVSGAIVKVRISREAQDLYSLRAERPEPGENAGSIHLTTSEAGLEAQLDHMLFTIRPEPTSR